MTRKDGDRQCRKEEIVMRRSQPREQPDNTYMSPKEHFRRGTSRGLLCDGNVVIKSDPQRLVLCDHGIQAGDVSQRPGFFFANLCHVVTDDLDLRTDGIRSMWCVKIDWTHSFLDTICLEGCKPSDASYSRLSETNIRVASLLPFATNLLFESRE